MRLPALCLLWIASLATPCAVAQQSAPAWKALQSLIGTWRAEPGSTPIGTVTAGGFTFTTELQGHALLRRNFAEYAASERRPAFRHDDLTIFYDAPAPHAIYYDNEGHRIEYAIVVSDDAKTITCTSAPKTGEPRFQFVYQLKDADTLAVVFYIAMPNAPDKFAKYVSGVAHRVK